MTEPAWRLLAGLPAWRVTELPRLVVPGGAAADGRGDPAGRARERRMLALASAARSGSAVAFGWVRETGRGPVRVLAAGRGLCADDDVADSAGGPVPLGYPAGAMGRALPPGGLAAALTVLPWWMPVAVTADALLAESEVAGLSPEDGLLPAWRRPFGWLVLAAPVGAGRRAELISEASLAQLMAERHDSPRAKLSALRARARHDELRQAATLGLWDVRLLAGAATRPGAARVAGLLCASLDVGVLPFGLSEVERCGPLPELLGAAPEAEAAAVPGPGPVAREVPGMQDGVPPRRGGAVPRAGPSRPGPASRWTPRAERHGEDGFAAWTPAVAAGWGRDGPSPTGSAAGSGLVPEFPDPEPEFPVAASSRLLAALAVPPSREIPGVRMVLRPEFDVTPESAAGEEGEDAVALGTVLDAGRIPSSVLSLPRASLNRHTFVCGATGAGKSQTVRHLLESATAGGIPWLVIEPAKAEYRLMAARLPDAEVVTIRPGDLDAVPAGINPLEPAAGPGGTRFPLQAHADLVRGLFLAAFRADEPFPQVLSAALARCYAESGWDMLTGEPSVEGASYPVLGDLQRAALAVVEEIGYSRDITDNVRGFVSVRIGSLRGGTTGRFLEGGFPLDFGRLLDGNVIVEIEDCGDDADKAFLTGAVLVRLAGHLRMRSRAEGPASPGLRHLTVVEEAHRLLRRPARGEGSGPAAHAVEMFAGLLAEIRAYGEGLVIAEQIPSKLVPDVIKNTAVKVVHRLPAADDRETVGATMNLTEGQSRFLVTLRPGEAAVFTDGMDYPVLAKMPDGSGREAGGTIRSGSIVGLVGGRSPGCPGDCRTAPCSLGLIAGAQRALKAGRRLRLWAELAVLAHLTGWPVPSPAPGFAAALGELGPRTRDCALGHAVEAAVASRAPVLVPRVPPGPLTAHVAAALRALVAGGGRCPREEPEWLAPAAEWEGVLDALSSSPGAGRHPRSAEWEAAHGRKIPGDTRAEQAAVVRGWHRREWGGDDRRRSLTIFGSGEPSAIETVLGHRSASPQWRERVAAVLDAAFVKAGWALGYLAPAVPAASGEAGP